MVNNLKSRRRKCGDAMEKAQNSIAWIDKEIERLLKLYKPLCKRLEEREGTLTNVKHNLHLAEKTMIQIMGQTKATSVSGMLANSKMQKKNASVHLKTVRGFGVDPSTTFSQNRRRSSYK
mmetsp:Transcript_13536/g.22094  ORF Transcript_13536/g.22094 Transcript_13536/m.22094 type:complete len:120 (+) Transcript_13536:80-439(+)